MARLINALEQLFSSEGISTGPSLLISYSSASGSFSVGETVTGGTSGATVVVKSSISPQITGLEVTGTFQVGETITGGTSGATATVDNFFLYDFPSGAAPLENGLIDFFESGSSTVRKTTYSDAGETLPNPNPVVIGGDGRVPDVYGTGNYRIVVRTSTGVQILARDPVGGDIGVSFGDGWVDSETYSENDVVRDDNKYWLSLTSGNIGNKPSTDGGVNWLELPLEEIANIATNTTNIGYNTDSRQALVVGSGQTFSTSNTDQMHKAVAEYSVMGLEVGDSGTANDHVLTLGAGRETLTTLEQLLIHYPVNVSNTGAVTVDFSLLLGQSAGTTVRDLRDVNDAALSGGECVAGGVAIVAYNTISGRAQLLNPANLSGSQIFHIQDQKVSGTNGGGTVANTWVTRDLNTVVENGISGASLSSNQITLPAGTFRFSSTHVAYDCNRNKPKLRNITDSSDTLIGESRSADAANNGNVSASISGNFTIGSSKTFEIQHRAETTQSGSGFGLSSNMSVIEVYSTVIIEKV